MKKSMKVLVSGVVIASTLTGGIVLASTLSTKERTLNLINQLQGIAQKYKDQFGGSNTEKEKYREVLEIMYNQLGATPPSDLSTVTDTEIQTLISNYINSLSTSEGLNQELINEIKTSAMNELLTNINTQLNTDYNNIDELIADYGEYKTSSGTNQGAKANLLNHLQTIYAILDPTNIPSEEQLLTKSTTEVLNDMNSYIDTQVAMGSSESARLSLEQVATALGMTNVSNPSVEDIQQYVNNMKTQYETTINNNNSNAEADMQEVEMAVRMAISQLDEIPNEEFEETDTPIGGTQGGNVQTEKEIAYNNLSAEAKGYVDQLSAKGYTTYVENQWYFSIGDYKHNPTDIRVPSNVWNEVKAYLQM